MLVWASVLLGRLLIHEADMPSGGPRPSRKRLDRLCTAITVVTRGAYLALCIRERCCLANVCLWLLLAGFAPVGITDSR